VTLLWALACTPPSTLAPVEDALGAEIVAEAGAGVRLAVAIDGLLAELCGVRAADGYAFVGAPARALGATTLAETRDEATGTLVWDLGEVGLEGRAGPLRVTTDTARTTLSVQWSTDGEALSGALDERCLADDGESALGGTLTHLLGGERRTLALVGEPPSQGLAWRLPPREVPAAGQVRWSRGEGPDAEVLLLDDATAITGGGWPGTASGDGWDARVTLPLAVE
jgi:hypothetical protein